MANDGPDLGSAVISMAVILSVVSTGIIAMRVWVRLTIRNSQRLSIDDGLIFVTYALGIVNTVMVIISARYGLGKHMADLMDRPEDIANAIKWVYLSEGPAIMAAGFARISFAILLLTITPPNKSGRRFLWAIMVIQLVFDLAAVIVTYAQCTPVAKYWNQANPLVEGTCWDATIQQYTGYVQGSVCSLVDLIMALYPISLFWNLHMKLEQKVYLSGIMGLGVIACVTSTGKTINLRAFTEAGDFTYALAQVAIWWTTEVNAVLIAVSMPALAPIIRPKKKLGSSGRSGPSGGGAVLNTFHSWKKNNARATNDTDGSFERLEEQELYRVNNPVDDSAPTPKTYDYSISSHYSRENMAPGEGIRRDFVVSTTSEQRH